MQSVAPAAASRNRGRPRRTDPTAPIARKRHEQIAHADAVNFSRALAHAGRLGARPNLFITIQWRHIESRAPIAERIQRLLNNIGGFQRRTCGFRSAIWAYVREVGKLKGEHLHLFVSVPEKHRSEFSRKIWGWLEMEAVGEAKRSALDIRSIADNGTDLWNRRNYVLKDGTDEVRAMYPSARKSTGGVVLGKRVQVSRALGRKAREMAGYEAG